MTTSIITLGHCMIPLLPLGGVLCVIYTKILFLKKDSSRLNKLSLLLLLLYNLYGWIVFATFWVVRDGNILAGFGETLFFSSLLLATFQFIGSFPSKTQRIGIFSLLPAFVLLSAAFLIPEKTWNHQNNNAFFVSHLILSLTAYAFYVVASVLAFMHLLLDRKLKSKQFDSVFLKLPSLEKMESYSSIWVLLGIIFSLSGSFFGILWWKESMQITFSGQGKWLSYLPFFYFLILWISYKSNKLRGTKYSSLILLGSVFLFITQSIIYFLY